jgi:hypothetical protein
VSFLSFQRYSYRARRKEKKWREDTPISGVALQSRVPPSCPEAPTGNSAVSIIHRCNSALLELGNSSTHGFQCLALCLYIGAPFLNLLKVKQSPSIIPSHMLTTCIWSPKLSNPQNQFYPLQPEFTIKPKSTFGGVLSGWLQWYSYLFEILDPAQQLSLRRGQLLQTATKSADHHLANQNSRAKRIPWCARLTARTLTISADEEHDENAILKSDPRMGQSRGN